MPRAPLRLAIMVSGGGSNMEALIQAAKRGDMPHAQIALVLSNRSDAGAIEKARRYGLETVIIPSKGIDDAMYQSAVLSVLEKHAIDVVCLAGYLKKVGPRIVERFRGRILNIHPGLLPQYGGAGMYGHFVHEAVLNACEVESGCTVHVVDDEFDHGPVLAQARVPVRRGDTPDTLAARILEQEHQLYPRVVAEFTEKLTRTLHD